MSSDILISKEIVRVLRHGKYGLKMDSRGYVAVNDILTAFAGGPYEIRLEDVQRIVRQDNKKRYDLRQQHGIWMIKASQGHSVRVENPDLQLITNPWKYDTILHGTRQRHWSIIQTEGLRRLRRTHIHFAIGLPGNRNVVSGIPPGCDVIIYLDVQKAMAGGLKLFESDNKVVLCEGDHEGRIHPKYFKKVVSLSGVELRFTVPPDYRY